MRIATYNIHRSVGNDGKEEPERILSVLNELNADIIALQEVGYASGEPGNLLDFLGKSTQSQVIEGITLKDERGHYGNAILSRFPVNLIKLHNISIPSREPRGAIELRLELEDKTIQIIATHLGLRPGERNIQVDKLMPLFDTSSADIKILMGDLNEWFLWGRPLRKLQRTFGSMPALATFPSRWPLFALDRIWIRPLSAIDCLRVLKSTNTKSASDHLPLFAQLNLD
ncbi:MAG: endonuclease/exonuclease/phosphatase family protein [Gammaproteobacteria bacterium]|jgi:endonuclease/exonuclease/phosphatase family metal-dependent hydrolase